MREIPLTQGKFAIVDDDDYEYLMQWKWYFDRGYARRGVCKNGKLTFFLMHRVVAKTAKGLCTDHKNRNKLDNRKDNLRICNYSENAQNMMTKHGNSRFKGVHFHRKDMVWQSYIKHNGKQVHLGSFDCEIEAAKAYNSAAQEFFGEFSCLNTI